MAAIDSEVPGHGLEGEALARLEAAEPSVSGSRKYKRPSDRAVLCIPIS
jgi:hypothetical protein